MSGMRISIGPAAAAGAAAAGAGAGAAAAAAGGDFMETAGGYTEMFNSAQITKRIEEEIGMLREVARRAGIEQE